VTLDGVNATAIDVREQSIRAQGNSQGGTVTVRRNWFPRWRATVNGEPAPITQTADGYMAVPVPPGVVTVELRYAVDGLDWAARGACVVGLVAAAGLLLIRGTGKWGGKGLEASGGGLSRLRPGSWGQRGSSGPRSAGGEDGPHRLASFPLRWARRLGRGRM